MARAQAQLDATQTNFAALCRYVGSLLLLLLLAYCTRIRTPHAHLGEPSATTEPSDLFGLLCAFFGAFDRAVAEIEYDVVVDDECSVDVRHTKARKTTRCEQTHEAHADETNAETCESLKRLNHNLCAVPPNMRSFTFQVRSFSEATRTTSKLESTPATARNKRRQRRSLSHRSDSS
jgi:hypothetical protein